MFDGYLLSFLSTYLSINDIIRLTRSSVLFREPILLETLERRIRSECSVRISDKQIIPLTLISKDGLFIFENNGSDISYSYFGQSTNNHICLCHRNRLECIMPCKTISLDVPIAEMFHNYNDGNMVREYYDVEYTMKIYFDISKSELFINRVTFEFVEQKVSSYTQLYNLISKYIWN